MTRRAGLAATPGSVSYNAAVESAGSRDTDPQPAAFAQRVHREAQRRGFDTAARRVVLGDGAPWIWNLSAEQFPGAVEIVDIYHAKKHLCDVAKAIYGAGTDLADARADEPQTPPDAHLTMMSCTPPSRADSIGGPLCGIIDRSHRRDAERVRPQRSANAVTHFVSRQNPSAPTSHDDVPSRLHRFLADRPSPSPP